MCSVVANSRIEIPPSATGVEFYSPAGRIIASLRNLPAGTRNVSLPAVMKGKGVAIVKFLYAK
jgi:hypothetical protein